MAESQEFREQPEFIVLRHPVESSEEVPPRLHSSAECIRERETLELYAVRNGQQEVEELLGCCTGNARHLYDRRVSTTGFSYTDRGDGTPGDLGAGLHR